MQRFFVSIYKIFRRRPALMWSTMVVSFLLFVVFAVQLKYEEDLTKLLPSTEKSRESQLAFGQLSIKDKIFVQIERTADSVEPAEMAEMCDELVDSILAPDSCSHLIRNVLYRIEDEWLVEGLDYALGHFPTLLGEDVYGAFDSLTTTEAIVASMKENAEILADDPEGNLASVIPYDPAGLRKAMIPELRGNILNTRTLERHFFSKDSCVVIAYVTPNIGSFDSKGCGKIVKHIEKSIKEFNQKHEGVRAVFHGASVLSAGNSRRIKTDIVITVAISLIIILIVITLCYRNRSTIGMIVIPIVYGTAFAMACMYLIKGKMSIMALGLAAPILGIAMSYVLHVLTHYKYVSNPITVLREQSTPVCLSCLTTIGAFAGLLFTTSDLLKDFGIFASIALVGTTLFALIYMPQFFNLERNVHNRKAFALLEKMNNYAIDRNKWLVGAIVLVSLACIVISVNPKTQVKFDKDLQNIGYRSETVVHSQHIYDVHINHGYVSKFYAAESENFDSAITYSRELVENIERLKGEDIVQNYTTVTPMLLTMDQQQANIDRWNNYWTTNKQVQMRRDIAKAANANGLEAETFEPFFTLIESDYEAEPIIESGILPDELACNFVEKMSTDSTEKYLIFTSVLTDSSHTYMAADSLTGPKNVIIADPFYYTGDMVEIVHKDFNIILLISSIFVIVVLLLSYKSIVMALLAFLPMFLSWYIVQGIMALFHIDFNLINIVLSSFIFGVGVDYSIFISNGLLAAERGHNMKLLTHHKTAITFSAFILIVVLSSMLFAEHPTLHSVGVCALIGMVSTISISYCLQPFLFRQLIKVPLFKKRMVGEK